jgi:hypothetical protein
MVLVDIGDPADPVPSFDEALRRLRARREIDAAQAAALQAMHDLLVWILCQGETELDPWFTLGDDRYRPAR